MSTAPTAADGQYTTHGYTSITPHLVVSPAERALERLDIAP